MINLLELFEGNKKQRIQLYDDIFLYEGQGVNVHGEPFSGKTTLCFNIIKNNPDKKVAYVNAERLTPRYINKLYSLSNNIYLVDINDSNLLSVIDILEQLPVDIIIVDSLTALCSSDERLVPKLLQIITNKNVFAIYVSQIRKFNNKEFYEHSKILNYFTMKIKVEKNNNIMILNKKYKMRFDSIWN